MPKTTHPLLDPEKQQQARQYEKEKRILGLAGLFWSFVILTIFYFSGLSGQISTLFSNGKFFWTFLFYGAVFLIYLTILSLPLSYLSSYRHEHKWNFSNLTKKAWIWEQFKAFLVSLIFLYIVLALLLWVMDRFSEDWWLIAALVLAGVSVLLTTLFPVLVLPLFNKYTPIEDEQLTGVLESILARGGLKSSGFFKQDMSRQTKKENAFLAGLGKTRRVVLADNLLNNMHVPEIESIIAHEVGHYRYAHLWKNIGIGTLQQILVFFLLHEIARRFFPGFLESSRANLTLLPVLGILMGLISGVLFGPMGQALSRRFERDADAYALDTISDTRDFQTALAGLADRNLSNAYPSWWVKFLYYSHPPIGERLKMADEFRDSKRVRIANSGTP